MKSTISKLQDLFNRNGMVDTTDTLEANNITGELIACVSEIATALNRLHRVAPEFKAAGDILAQSEPAGDLQNAMAQRLVDGLSSAVGENRNADAVAWGSFYDTDPGVMRVLEMRNMLVSYGVCEVTGALITALEQLADDSSDTNDSYKYLRETRRRMLEAFTK